MKAGPWFPYLFLYGDARLSDHCVHHPKPKKSAGKTNKAPAASAVADGAAAASDGAGATAGEADEFASPAQNK